MSAKELSQCEGQTKELQLKVITAADKFLDKLVLTTYGILGAEIVLFCRVDPFTTDLTVTHAVKGDKAIGLTIPTGIGVEGNIDDFIF